MAPSVVILAVSAALSQATASLSDDSSNLLQHKMKRHEERDQLIKRGQARLANAVDEKRTALMDQTILGKTQDGEDAEPCKVNLAFINICLKRHPEGTNAQTGGGGGSSSGGSGTAVAASSHFASAQKSPFTGNEYSQIEQWEWDVAQEINRVRKQGFQCYEDYEKTIQADYYPPRTLDLKFDCRLWWTARLHSEDMVTRGFYAHNTQTGTYFNQTSNAQEQFQTALSPFQRADQWAWGMVSHAEIITTQPTNASNGAKVSDADYAEKVVQSWLDSPAHCSALGSEYNQLVGTGAYFCEKTSLTDSICNPSLAGPDPTTGRWFWTAMFTYASPATDAVPAGRVFTPRIVEVGDDISCQMSPTDTIG